MLIVAHSDGHPHVIVDRGDTESGKAAGLSKSRLRLSKWAEGYEQGQGRIRCSRRVTNNARRGRVERVRDRVSVSTGRHQREKMNPHRKLGEATAAGLDGREQERRAEGRTHWERLQRRRGGGTVIIAPGANRAWNAPVLEIASQVRAEGPVEVSFLMGEEAPAYRFQDAVSRLVVRGAERIVVVPLLASSFSGRYEQLRYLTGTVDELDESLLRFLETMGAERPGVDVPLKLMLALDASPEIATILAERALRLAEAPSEQALHIIGHGPNSAEDHAESLRNLRPVADSIAALTGRDVVVVPLLISRSYLSTERRPADLEGLAIAHDGDGLLPHPELAAWISRRVREAVDG